MTDPRMEEKNRALRERKERFRLGGGPEAIKRQHDRGKLTARERLDLLLDPGTLVEYDLLVTSASKEMGLDEMDTPGDGSISGWGEIGGRKVWVFAQDFTVLGGTHGEMHMKKFYRTMERALQTRTPIILVEDSGGRRPQEQNTDEKGQGERFYRHTVLSGVVPQITLVMGPVAGGPCYGPALTDFIFMVKGISSLFIGGPPVVKEMIGEEVTAQQLGGADVHSRVSGVCDVAFDSEQQCLARTRELMGFLPSSNLEKPPVVDTGDPPGRMDDSLGDIVPADGKKSYNMHEVIKRLVDNGHFFEIKPEYARNIIVGFARLAGQSVGIVASQPMVMGGIMDIDSSDKGARFIRFCDCFNIPIVNLVDTPAYLVGTKMEQGGIIRHGAKLLYAQSEVTVPRVTVVLRKGYGGGYSAMGPRGTGSDILFAWPIAEFGTFGVDAAMSILLRTSVIKKRLEAAKDKDALIAQWKKEFYDKHIDLYSVAPHRHVDDIIEPKETRPAIINAFKILSGKKAELPWKKHGNMPV